jgi:hypothetical protein
LPFEFTGPIHTVTFHVSGDVIRDSEAEMRLVWSDNSQQAGAGQCKNALHLRYP